jgi:hypothetical protein
MWGRNSGPFLSSLSAQEAHSGWLCFRVTGHHRLSCTSLLQHMFGEAPLCKLGYIATNPVAGVELLRERSGERAEWSANTRQPGVPGCPSCLMAPLAERSQRQAGGSHAAPQAFERRLGIGEVDMIASSRT